MTLACQVTFQSDSSATAICHCDHIIVITYTPCSEKRVPTYFVSVKYEPINMSWNKHLTSPEICAITTFGNLKCQIEPSTQYLYVHFNESSNSYKTTGSYCLENRQISRRSASAYFRWSGHFMLSFVTCCFQDIPTDFDRSRFIFDRHRGKNRLACSSTQYNKWIQGGPPKVRQT